MKTKGISWMMMRNIGFGERLRLLKRQRKLKQYDRTLVSALRVFNSQNLEDRPRINGILEKRCDLQDEIIVVSRWLAQGSRPVEIAPTRSGKGLPPGSLPLPGTDPEVLT